MVQIAGLQLTFRYADWNKPEFTSTPATSADELTSTGVALSLGGSGYDPTNPVGRLLFNVLSMVAEFEADLIRMHTRDDMAVARATGRLRASNPSCPRHNAAIS